MGRKPKMSNKEQDQVGNLKQKQTNTMGRKPKISDKEPAQAGNLKRKRKITRGRKPKILNKEPDQVGNLKQKQKRTQRISGPTTRTKTRPEQGKLIPKTEETKERASSSRKPSTISKRKKGASYSSSVTKKRKVSCSPKLDVSIKIEGRSSTDDGTDSSNSDSEICLQDRLCPHNLRKRKPRVEYIPEYFLKPKRKVSRKRRQNISVPEIISVVKRRRSSSNSVELDGNSEAKVDMTPCPELQGGNVKHELELDTSDEDGVLHSNLDYDSQYVKTETLSTTGKDTTQNSMYSNSQLATTEDLNYSTQGPSVAGKTDLDEQQASEPVAVVTYNKATQTDHPLLLGRSHSETVAYPFCLLEYGLPCPCIRKNMTSNPQPEENKPLIVLNATIHHHPLSTTNESLVFVNNCILSLLYKPESLQKHNALQKLQRRYNTLMQEYSRCVCGFFTLYWSVF